MKATSRLARKWIKWSCLAGSLVLSAAGLADPAKAQKQSVESRPNFLLIVLDDLAYSDLGSFGGEIATPNLDRLANQGLRFTNFYAAAACSPSRAMLLTGADSHLVGLGNMDEFLSDDQRGKPGYEGHLNNRVDTVATRLRAAGYHTYMSGKWHLGSKPGSLPRDQGFERSFALMHGGGNHFDQRGVTEQHPVADYREQGQHTRLPEDVFSSNSYTDKLLNYLRQDAGDGKPFFAYLAYTAPHWPLQAPQAYIERYRGKYNQGYDQLRTARLQNMQALGITEDNNDDAFPLNPATGYRPWTELDKAEQQRQARIMEVYAAMVEATDAQVGRVLTQLEQQGQLDNTVIVFLSDNGAEGFDKSEWPPFKAWVEQFDNRLEALGSKDAFPFYGPGWGTAGTAPFRMFKGFSTDGGLRTPAFIWNPNLKRQGQISQQLVTVMDIAPTLLTLAGINNPTPQDPGQRGRTMLPYLMEQKESVHSATEAIGWELMGNAAIRQGDWKLVRAFKPFGSGQWQLFNLSRDPAETRDVASAFPNKYRELLQAWDDYARHNGVLLPEWGWKDRLQKAYLFGTGAL